MKSISKNSLMLPAFLVGLTVAFFQNCSKVAVSDLPTSNKDSVVSATDTNTGQDVPVNVQTPDTVHTPPGGTNSGNPPDGGSQPPMTTSGDVTVGDDTGNPPSGDEGGDVGQVFADHCGVDLKTIPHVVDLAQFENQDVKLNVKGKTLIYSSNPDYNLKSMVIDDARGRTILCGIKVDEIHMKKGRLDLHHCQVTHIDNLKGTINADTDSILPTGF